MQYLRSAVLLFACLGFTACGDSSGNLAADLGPDMPTGIAALGNGSHSISNVLVEELGNASLGLNLPRDVAFHPTRNELWIVNRADPADLAPVDNRRGKMTVISEPGTANQTAKSYATAAGGYHFFVEPSAIAFGENGNFASIHETDKKTQGPTPFDFMGPVLWGSGPNFDAGHASHLDMLHNSPLGMGIAWERDNTYWIFDGYHSSITRYAFNSDHGPGGADHSDGHITRYVEGQVSRVANVPSHMVIDGDRLYVADTGNSRIAILDITTGEDGPNLPPLKNFDGISVFNSKVNATFVTFIDGTAITPAMNRPSGVHLDGKTLYVTDNQNATIYAFDTDTASLIDWLDTERADGALSGITGDDQGRLFITDTLEHKLLRIRSR